MSEFKIIETQEELDKIIKDRLALQKESIESKFEDYDQLKLRNEELEATNTAQQKAIEEANKAAESFDQEKSELSAKIAGYETANLKNKIALQAGLPLDIADRLVGDDEEALKADAERLGGFMKPKAPTPPLKGSEPSGKDGKNAAYRTLVQNLSIEGE